PRQLERQLGRRLREGRLEPDAGGSNARQEGRRARLEDQSTIAVEASIHRGSPGLAASSALRRVGGSKLYATAGDTRRYERAGRVAPAVAARYTEVAKIYAERDYLGKR